MSKDRGYLQTITCSINLSSCRLRAESLARALNSRLWSTRGLSNGKQRSGPYDTFLKVDSKSKIETSSNGMANVVNQPVRGQLQSYQVNRDNQLMVGHGWINEMASEDNEELFDTPPCSSPPSPVDDEEDIIVNPPTLNKDPLPFTTKFLRDIKYSDAFSDSSKLREKLRQYADGLLSSADDITETFYDASEDDRLSECNQISLCNPQPLADKLNFENITSIESITTKDIDNCQSEVEGINQKCSCGAENCCENGISVPNLQIAVNGEIKSFPCVVTDEQYDPSKILPVPDNPNYSFSDAAEKQDQKSVKINNRDIQKVQELEGEEERPKLLRTTSLKTGKTPPGTPGRKKIVRFADVLGLDLEDVRHIVCDDLPTVPPSAYNDLKLPPEDISISVKPRQKSFNIGHEIWNMAPAVPGSPLSGVVPLFDMPVLDSNFPDRVRADWVSLEKVTVADLSVHCMCRVLNVSYEKTVVARYTTNEWQSFDEVVASYVPFSSDGEFDTFSFSLFLQPFQKQANGRFLFAIRYNTKGLEQWDNNKGQNYILRFQDADDSATSRLLPTLEDESTWLHHFY